MGEPNRWLHLRHADGFDDARFAVFVAQCRVWQAHVNALLANSEVLLGRPAPTIEHFAPERSAERTVVTLPVGGDWDHGTRRVELPRAHLLWEWFPPDFCEGLEEGLTEPDPLHGGTGPTRWHPVVGHIIGDSRRVQALGRRGEKP